MLPKSAVAAIVLAVLTVFAVPLQAGAITGVSITQGWTELNIAGPHNNSDYGFAWGTPTGRSAYGLLFGGRQNTSGGIYDQTWIFQSGRWARLNITPHPPASMHPMLAWDPDQNEFVLFGGSGNRSYFSDTWAFSTGHWTQLFPKQSPPPRRSGSMDWDPNLRQIVLFGGHSAYPGKPFWNQSYFRMYNDTWGFDGLSWTNLTKQVGPAAPPPESEPSLAFDKTLHATIEFGGYNQGTPMTIPNGKYVAFNSTWGLYGGHWHNLTLVHSPYVRDGAGLVWDPVRNGLLLYGGQDEASHNGWTNDNDSWVLGCASRASCEWIELTTTTTPPKEDSMTLVWDTQSRQVITFGGCGQDPFDRTKHVYMFAGTWTFD